MKCFPGATSRHLTHYVVPTLDEKFFDTAIIHVGINDMLNDCGKRKQDELCNNIIRIIKLCEDSGISRILISGLVQSSKVSPDVIDQVNKSLKEICLTNDLVFIDNSNIFSTNLYKDGIHLLESGKVVLARNFISCLNNFLKLKVRHLFLG